MTEYVSVDDLIVTAHRFLGHEPEVADPGVLASAAARPRATVFGTDAYPDLHTKAAALLHALVKNHPLVDGNKRLGWVGVNLFYGYNGYELAVAQDDAFDLVMGIASGGREDVAEIAKTLAGWVQPLRLDG